MKRIYRSVIEAHLRDYQQMIILTGPDAIGKTTLMEEIINDLKYALYLNWHVDSHCESVLEGPEKVYKKVASSNVHSKKFPVIFFDELNLYKNWKNLLKGYYDVLSSRCRFVIAINERVDTYRAGKDSMMGRYFSYRIHPLTVSELCGRSNFSNEYISPCKISMEDWNNLLAFGGFPEPFQKSTKSFHTRWSNECQNQLIKENIRNLTKINDLHRIGLFAKILKKNVGLIVSLNKIASDLQVTAPTVQSWFTVLSNYYYGFGLSPWSNNVKRSLRKAQKFYLSDWSQIKESNKRIENLVACHLKKAVDFWSDIGLGSYELYYLCDKDKREVDFLVVKDQEPWLMVDVGFKNKSLSQNLLRFQEQLKVPYVFQVVSDLPYVDKDCFSVNKPVIVPLMTFLSQLI